MQRATHDQYFLIAGLKNDPIGSRGVCLMSKVGRWYFKRASPPQAAAELLLAADRIESIRAGRPRVTGVPSRRRRGRG